MTNCQVFGQTLIISNKFDKASLTKKVNWLLNESQVINWLKKSTDYYLTVTDSLDRAFKVRPQQTYFDSELTGRERRYYLLEKFESASPFYNFYWTNLINTVPFLLEDQRTRMCFHGHGCATKPESINNPLSKKRDAIF